MGGAVVPLDHETTTTDRQDARDRRAEVDRQAALEWLAQMRRNPLGYQPLRDASVARVSDLGLQVVARVSGVAIEQLHAVYRAQRAGAVSAVRRGSARIAMSRPVDSLGAAARRVARPQRRARHLDQ